MANPRSWTFWSPELAPGEVLVRIADAGVNPADWKGTGGALVHFHNHAFPWGLGNDVPVRSRRWGPVRSCSPSGTGARHVLATADRHGSRWSRSTGDGPGQGIGASVTAAAPTAGMTALGLLDVGGVCSGRTLLLVDASGGVGSFATQLAAAPSVRVLAVTRGTGEASMGRPGAAESCRRQDKRLLAGQFG